MTQQVCSEREGLTLRVIPPRFSRRPRYDRLTFLFEGGFRRRRARHCVDPRPLPVWAFGRGKTTLCERLLYDAGVINRLGDVEHGNTVSDYTPEEQRHKHSLQPSFIHFDHEDHHVCVIDTPGMADFIGHTIACFPAVESVVVVIDAAKGD